MSGRALLWSGFALFLAGCAAVPEALPLINAEVSVYCHGDLISRLVVEVDKAGKFTIPVEQIRQKACNGA